MSSSPESGSADGVGPTLERVKRVAITGAALTVPVLLTLVVLQLVLGVVAQAIAPVVVTIELLLGLGGTSTLTLQVLAVATLAVIVLVVGAVAESHPGSTRLATGFHAFMARIPGLGSVYTGIRRLSSVLLEQDTQSFKEVKLVEFPRSDAYMVGFLTAHPPEAVETAADESDMQTLFVPLAPNPVMGGFLVHLPDERVHDVDLTVEEGLQSIVTSGAAVDPRLDADEVGGAPLTRTLDVDRAALRRAVQERDVLDRDAIESTLREGTPFGEVADDEES